MAFQVFKREIYSRPLEAPTVTVDTRGAVRLNPAAVEAIGSPKHVELLFDSAVGVAGIRACDGGAPNAYLVSKSRQISCSAFTAYCRFERSKRYPARFEEGLLKFRIGDPDAVRVRSNRSGT